MNTPANDRQYTPHGYRRTIRHRGPCGRRTTCWRPSCRAEFPGYPSVEVLSTGEMIAYCHNETYPAGDLLARLAS